MTGQGIVRHLACACAFLALVFGGVIAVDRLAQVGAKPGTVWVLTRGSPGAALAALPEGSDLRVLRVWAHGRVLQLHAANVAAPLPRGIALWALRASPPLLLLPACG